MDLLFSTRAALFFAVSALCLQAEPARGQTSAAGARDAALAGASSAASVSADMWSEANPAGWSQLEGMSAAIHVAQLYGLDELRLGAAQLSFDAWRTAVVAGVRTLGYDDYRETASTIGAARSFRWGTYRPLHAGIRFRYHHASIRTYGAASASTISAGFVVPIAQSTHIGFAAENLFILAGRLKPELPRLLHAGLSISAGSMTLLAGASKDVRTPLAVRLGVEVHPVEVLALRAGYSLEPPRLTGGIGLRLLPLTVDIAAERHFVLGWTPSCSVGMRW